MALSFPKATKAVKVQLPPLTAATKTLAVLWSFATTAGEINKYPA
jgi:hypothetical protein